MEPRAIVGIDVKPVLVPGTQAPLVRPDGSRPMRQTVQYADGRYEIYEYDERDPPPTPGEPWGTFQSFGQNQQQAAAYRAVAKEPTIRQEAPPTVGGGPAGTLVYNPQTQRYEPIPGTQPVPSASAGSWQNGVFYGAPGAAIPEALTYDPIALAERQRATAESAERLRLAQEAERRQGIQTQLDVIQAAERAGEIDAKRAQELRDYLWRTEVEFPQKLREQEDVVQRNAIERGRFAGEAAVSDITAQLPYRYSPGFEARQQAVQAEAARGNFTPGIYQSIARSYRGPDLAGARQQAERRYEQQYLTQFGFDPLETAGQVGYRAPVASAPAMAPLADDEEQIKRLAAQLAGG